MYKIIITYILLILSGDIMSANQLKNSTSPYLLQHKNNPVEWYEWGEEAFKKAKKENKFIFLSIGYSTCHWCHVMARESFEDTEVAKILNENYISIKVDKEQLPHIDNYYQLAYRLVNKKGGGWPLTVILTPKIKPFFLATYIPKSEGYGSRGLIDILNSFSSHDKKQIDDSAEIISNMIDGYQNSKSKSVKLDSLIVKKAIAGHKKNYDFRYKGIGNRPKFPQASSIDSMLWLYQLSLNKLAFEMATDMLSAMANGGIYDQIDGGFYRYSVDERWEIPHFEKMLYTNGELISTYVKAYHVKKNPLYKKVIDESIEEIDRRFLYQDLYFSASNADSKNAKGEEEEGYFFVYDYETTYEYLEKNGISKSDINESMHYFGIVEDGNYDGDMSNPHVTTAIKPKAYTEVLSLLKEMREAKSYPFIDKKINTAWNAMMIKSKFEAGYIKSAKKSLDALLNLMYKNAVLYHQTLLPNKPKQEGLLEDYAFLADCLFIAYQVTLDKEYLELFRSLTRKSVELFYKEERWRESTDSFVTFATLEDNNYASELSINLENILKLSVVDADFKLQSIVKKTISDFSQLINSYPSYYPNASKVAIMLKQDMLFIKSSKKNLDMIDVHKLSYPFVYKLESDKDDYLLCGLESCFSVSKDLKTIIEAIEKLHPSH
ncbi:MAG TPA: thioredoxin domain-containing protein [Campylobacterales bacterium]|nr:thioredoxin domain-containing protein [Campylobacterales bacterium]